MKKLACLSVFLLSVIAQAQDSVGHARQILDLLRQEKFSDVAKEFNPQVAAGLPAPALAQAWSALRTQVGEFKSEIDQQSAAIRGGTAVTIGAQFERAALNIIVVFDPENKIAGLQFVPRAASAAVRTLPAGLTEEALTVGSGEFALPGTLTLPQGNGKTSAIVLVHFGATGSRLHSGSKQTVSRSRMGIGSARHRGAAL
jgi:hypothetical protein